MTARKVCSCSTLIEFRTKVLADLTEEQMKESDAGLYRGVVTAYAFGVVMFFWATNGFFIKWCQTHDVGTSNDDGGGGGGGSKGKMTTIIALAAKFWIPQAQMMIPWKMQRKAN